MHHRSQIYSSQLFVVWKTNGNQDIVRDGGDDSSCCHTLDLYSVLTSAGAPALPFLSRSHLYLKEKRGGHEVIIAFEMISHNKLYSCVWIVLCDYFKAKQRVGKPTRHITWRGSGKWQARKQVAEMWTFLIFIISMKKISVIKDAHLKHCRRGSEARKNSLLGGSLNMETGFIQAHKENLIMKSRNRYFCHMPLISSKFLG